MLWTAPKASDADYAYLIFALGRVADGDFTNALGNLLKSLLRIHRNLCRNICIMIGYVGGTTVSDEEWLLIVEVLNAYDPVKLWLSSLSSEELKFVASSHSIWCMGKFDSCD